MIEIEQGLLKKPEKWVAFLKTLSSKYAIVTDEKVGALYGKSLAKRVEEGGMKAHLITFPSGEGSKTRETKQRIEDQMFEAGLGRDGGLIALGGGVVTDLGGFVAATFCRGIPHVLFPTSFLGMVDASIGGKTGVDVPYGKNLIGAIYQPRKIYIDVEVLKSLPVEEVRNGSVEMIKHALIHDEGLFAFFEREREKILGLDLKVLEQAIAKSARIKEKIVEEDEKETGKRRLLNLGHTVAHAIETLSDYRLPHGEAVAIGIVTEAYMGVEMKILNVDTLERIHRLLKSYGLPFKLPSSYKLEEIEAVMFHDKKSLKGRPRFAMIEGIGKPLAYDEQYCTFIDERIIMGALNWMLHDLCRH